MSKNLVNQYVWLADKIYRAGRITLAQINEDRIISGYDPINKRTFHNWQKAIEDVFDILIKCNRKGRDYYYYIENKEDLKKNNLKNWLFNSLSTSNLLVENKHLKEFILIDDIPSGHTHLQPIIEAIKNKKKIEFIYRKFEQSEEKKRVLCPLCVKLDRQRWYVIGETDKKEKRTFGLERILELSEMEETFIYPEDFDSETYLDGCVGVYVDTNNPIQKVIIKVDKRQANYIRSLRIHESQKEVESNDEYSIFQYRVRPTIDFIQELLKHGERLEVIEPESIRVEMKKIIEKMLERYK